MALTAPKPEDLLTAALAYQARGWSIIPTVGKEARTPWKRFQSCPASPAELQSLFALQGIDGLAVVLGAVSGGLACRDFDRSDAYDCWAEANNDDAARLPTVKTSRGYHVYGRLEIEQYVKFDDGELRGNSGHYTLLPPSLHPDGIVYTWTIPLPEGELLALPTSLALTQKIQAKPVDPAEPDTQTPIAWWTSAIISTLPSGPGQRNGCIFELARRLKAIKPDAAHAELRSVLKEWHRLALPVIRTKEFGESWTDFTIAWDRVRRPSGQSFAMAAAAADAADLPANMDQFGYDGNLRRLAALCWRLQQQWGDRPFPLGCKIAGQHVGLSTRQGGRLLKTLKFDGVLKLTTKGSKRTGKASEWRFNGFEPGNKEQ
jgi:hypothetical protein